MNQEKQIIEMYREGKTAKVFDSERHRYAFQQDKHFIEASFLRNVLKKLADKNNPKILDVACGTGRMLKTVWMTHPGAKYYGLDTSKEMVKHLHSKAKKINIKTNLKIGDATKIPFEDNYFDLVYTYHLLWHLPKNTQEKIIKEMLRVTKKGGYIIFDILNKDFLWEKLKKFLKINNTEGIYKQSVQEINKLVSPKSTKIEKLSDFPIKNNSLYSVANLVNRSRKILPIGLFHMVYFEVKK